MRVFPELDMSFIRREVASVSYATPGLSYQSNLAALLIYLSPSAFSPNDRGLQLSVSRAHLHPMTWASGCRESIAVSGTALVPKCSVVLCMLQESICTTGGGRLCGSGVWRNQGRRLPDKP